MNARGLRIAMVNTALSQGGAASAVGQLCAAFNAHSAVDCATVSHAQNNIRDAFGEGYRLPGARQANALLARLGGSSAMRDFGFTEHFNTRFGDYDVLHIHNLHGYYLGYETLISSWSDRPVVWTWHDMWGATGRCGFSFDCIGWQTGCIRCPDKTLYPAAWIDRAFIEYDQKFDAFMGLNNLSIVCPSHWLAEIAIKRGFNPESVHVIPYTVDFNLFKPGDRAGLRRKHSLPFEGLVALFVAAACDDPRKGYQDFAEATKGLDCTAVAIGSFPQKKAEHIQHLGATEERLLLAEFYQLADVLVVPSLADNYPNTVLEATACGTPSVGYAVGGLAELLQIPGCRALAAGDVSGIEAFLVALRSTDKEVRLATREQLSYYAGKLWNPTVVADRYLALMQ